MATKKPKVLVKAPETREEHIEYAIKNNHHHKPYVEIHEPTRFFNEGQSVAIGNLSDCKVECIFNDNKNLVISYATKRKEMINGRMEEVIDKEKREYKVWEWYSVYPENDQDTPDISRRRNVHQAITTSLYGLLNRTLYFGVNPNPPYQRDYVWTLNDKVRLIDSIMMGRDIGKFIFVRHPFPVLDCIVDGKQRMNAIEDFFLGKYTYKGKFFHELSYFDRHNFKELPVQLVELNDKTPEVEVLELFIEMNYSGVPQTEEHIMKVKLMLEELLEKGN